MKLKSVFLAILILAVSLCFVAPVFTQDQGQVISPETQQKIDERKKEIEKRIEDRKKTITQPLPLTREDVEKKPAETEEASEPETTKEEAEQPEAQQPEAEQPMPVQPEPQPVAPQIPQPSKAPATVSFFFDDADVFEVAKTIFADVLKVNYIIDPQVKGRVNFRTVTPIPKDEVLSVMEIIFRLNGIGFVEEGGLYRIIPLADVSKELIYSQIGKAPEKVAIEMFTFKNLDLKESMPDIENALGLHLKGGTVRIVPIFRLNALIVVASGQEHLVYVRKWIEVFDSMFATARPKIFVYSLQNSKAEHIASLLQSIFTGSAATTSTTAPKPATTPKPATKGAAAAPAAPAATTGPAAAVTGGGGTFVAAETRVFADEITNSLIILATPADYSFIEETIKKLDILPRQVMIEALVAEIKLTDDMTFGLAWSLKTDVNLSGLKPFDKDINLGGQMGQRPSAISGTDAAILSGSGFSFLATDASGIVRAKLEALASESKAKVLASPHILVLDNREAKIQIGDQVPIATSEYQISGSETIQKTIQYKDTGVILTVKPQINEGGLVSLEISQEVSNFYLKSILGTEQVVISKREATTNLIAQDGQTIVIGGLIQEDTSKSRDGIPFLSKIPILGYLFGNTINTYSRKELVILITPHVIRNQQEAGEITEGYVRRLKGVSQEIKKEDLIKEKLVEDGLLLDRGKKEQGAQKEDTKQSNP